MRIEERVEIGRPPIAVWELVADHGNDPRWCRKVKRVQATGDGRWNVWHKPVPLRPATLLEIEHVRADAPSYLALREEDDASLFEIEYRLTATSAGTSFVQLGEVTWKKLPSALQPIFNLGVRRDVSGQLRALKQLLEASGAVAHGPS